MEERPARNSRHCPKTWQPSSHGLTVLLVGLPECRPQMRLFVHDYKEVREQQPRQREQQDRWRFLVQSETEQNAKCPDIHRVAHVAIGANSYKLARRVEWGRRA